MLAASVLTRRPACEVYVPQNFSQRPGGLGGQPLCTTRFDRRKVRTRTKPAPAKNVQSKSDRGSGVPESVTARDVTEEVEEEAGGSRVNLTPGVCDTSWGGEFALVTFREKFRTPLAANPP